MAQKRNLVLAVALVLMIVVAIVAFAALSTREVGITSLGVTGSPTPIIVAPQSAQDGAQLAWDCPTCPV